MPFRTKGENMQHFQIEYFKTFLCIAKLKCFCFLSNKWSYCYRERFFSFMIATIFERKYLQRYLRSIAFHCKAAVTFFFEANKIANKILGLMLIFKFQTVSLLVCVCVRSIKFKRKPIRFFLFMHVQVHCSDIANEQWNTEKKTESVISTLKWHYPWIYCNNIWLFWSYPDFPQSTPYPNTMHIAALSRQSLSIFVYSHIHIENLKHKL